MFVINEQLTKQTAPQAISSVIVVSFLTIILLDYHVTLVTAQVSLVTIRWTHLHRLAKPQHKGV